MKKITILALVASMAGLMAFKAAFTPLPIGAAMPMTDVPMKDVTGKDITLGAAKTKAGLLVMFSCNTCPYVIKNQERTLEACKFAKKNGLGIVIVNSNEALRGDEDSYDAMKAYAKEQGYDWHYLVDPKSSLADAFGANRTPECFLFDKDAKLVYHGAIDDNPSDASNVTRKHLQEAITEMNGGKEISVKESRSVGCTIKRKS
jgi:peroxiredoxin